jgi:hypothetical protein
MKSYLFSGGYDVTRKTQNFKLFTPRKVKNIDELFGISDPFELIFTLNGLINCQSEEDYRKLPEKARMVVALDAFHLEVENGGFYQFLFTASGDLSDDIQDYLCKVSAPKTCALLEHIAAEFPGGAIPVNRTERNKILDKMEDDCDDLELFEKETEEYHESGEQILDLLIAYLKPHTREFEEYIKKSTGDK